MKCQSCNNEMFIDHTEQSADGLIEKYVYVCVNPRCSAYRKAATLTGEDAVAKIQPRRSR